MTDRPSARLSVDNMDWPDPPTDSPEAPPLDLNDLSELAAAGVRLYEAIAAGSFSLGEVRAAFFGMNLTRHRTTLTGDESDDHTH